MYKIATISQVPELKSKKVLLRIDVNPIIEGKIAEKFRIEAHRKTIEYLRERGAIVVLVSHITSENEPLRFTEDLRKQLTELLGIEFRFIVESSKTAGGFTIAEDTHFIDGLFLLDNIRLWPGEEINDTSFAKELAAPFDLYVNDAFSVCHRAHASVSAITEFLPSYAGLVTQNEIEKLSQALAAPTLGKVVVMGGAKISTKLPVMKNLLEKAEAILVGGALANTLIKAKGIAVGASKVDAIDTAAIEYLLHNDRVLLPEDIVISPDGSGATMPSIVKTSDIAADQKILDVGPLTVRRFGEIIKNAKLVIWNGPLGLAEIAVFAKATKFIADAIARSDAQSIAGGGDTIAFLEKANMMEQFDFVSTGGGALLAFLAGEKLPGLEALGYYQ